MCGEKLVLRIVGGLCLGSPPHVRGKVVPLLVFRFHDGITPACAGKSGRGSSVFFHRWDHPRMCGEKFSFISFFSCSMGSPPHVRGKD